MTKFGTFALCAALPLAACGNLTIVTPHNGSLPSYTVGGSICGYSTGSGLGINGGPAGTINIDAGATAYTLPSALNAGTSYTVSVTSNPTGAICSVQNPSGVIGSANVTNANIVCGDVCPYNSNKPVVPRDGPSLTQGATIKSPAGLTVDSRGTIYVADTTSNAIVAIAPDGGVVSFTGFESPIDVAVSPDFTLYVLNKHGYDNNVANYVAKVPRVDRLTTATAVVPTQVGPDLGNASSLSLGASGTLYLASADDGRVMTLSTTLVPDAGRPTVRTQGGEIYRPNAAIEGPDGVLYVSSEEDSAIYKVDDAGVGNYKLDDAGIAIYNVDDAGVEVPTRNATVFIADAGRVVDIAMDSAGNLYTLRQARGTSQSGVSVFPRDGGKPYDIGGPLYYPHAIWVSPAGDTVYATETGGGVKQVTK